MDFSLPAAAVDKSLQSCLTLHDPKDCSLPGSSDHGTFQARTLEWVAIAFSFSLPSDKKKKKYIDINIDIYFLFKSYIRNFKKWRKDSTMVVMV